MVLFIYVNSTKYDAMSCIFLFILSISKKHILNLDSQNFSYIFIMSCEFFDIFKYVSYMYHTLLIEHDMYPIWIMYMCIIGLEHL